MPPPPLGPTTLEGRFVRLEPLRPHHTAALLAVADNPDIWRGFPADLRAEAAMAAWIADANAAESLGTECAFAVWHRPSGTYVGSTRYLDISAAHRGVEIGWTWSAPQFWGSAVNPECKLLLRRHAFETWGAIRVYFKTDVRNTHSQAALRKLGATYEGTLRQHRIRADGTYRDSVYFSVLDGEWPTVRDGLLARIERAGAGTAGPA